MYLVERSILKNKIHPDIWEQLENHSCYIAGGAITSIFTGNPINDFDIYFRSRKDYYEFFNNLYNTITLVYCSHNALSFIVNDGREESKKTVYQAVCTGYYENAEEIFNDFDYTINMGAYDCKTGEFVFDDRFMIDNARRALVFNPNTKYPVASALRMSKYKDRGYTISKSNILKIAFTIAKQNITTWEEFEGNIGGAYGEIVHINIDYNTPFDLDTAMSLLSDEMYITSQDEVRQNFITGRRILDKVFETCQYKKHRRILNKSRTIVVYYNDDDKLIIKNNDIFSNPERYDDEYIRYDSISPIRFFIPLYINNDKICIKNRPYIFSEAIDGHVYKDCHLQNLQYQDLDEALSNEEEIIGEVEIINPKDIEAVTIDGIVKVKRFRFIRVAYNRNEDKSPANPEYFDTE